MALILRTVEKIVQRSLIGNHSKLILLLSLHICITAHLLLFLFGILHNCVYLCGSAWLLRIAVPEIVIVSLHVQRLVGSLIAGCSSSSHCSWTDVSFFFAFFLTLNLCKSQHCNWLPRLSAFSRRLWLEWRK